MALPPYPIAVPNVNLCLCPMGTCLWMVFGQCLSVHYTEVSLYTYFQVHMYTGICVEFFASFACRVGDKYILRNYSRYYTPLLSILVASITMFGEFGSVDRVMLL